MISESQRTAIVTGGGSGIGRGIAEALVREGARVALIGRDREKLDQAIKSMGPAAICRQADVGQRDQIATAVAEIVRDFGQIDVLVNNAGIARSVTTQTPLEEAEAAFDDVFRINVKGAILMALTVAPYLSRPGGRILNIGSVAAFTGGHGPGSIVYAASKAALAGLTYALARELSVEGITVNTLAPGLIDTEFNIDYPQPIQRAIVGETPMGRKGRVEDVVAAALYLVSTQASFVTGEILGVNGGRIFGR